MSDMFEDAYKNEPTWIVVLKAIVWLPVMLIYVEGQLGLEMWKELGRRWDARTKKGEAR
jgi:hypothetical protein